ncbi:hypothetical protein SADUNF_Sadunf18G0087300 [Salix dunnii]|uniref:Formin-like protein n=1 Tax=Salix dunnii TaxID=1413687 RepID=A0A835J4P2_9ROSI|nr:hypothetical protein SADUNF_Sadunf18G0087300 [Salix dunnii]
MSLFRKLFYRKPPDGLLEISERVYVFDCCFNIDAWQEDYEGYVGRIVGQLKEHFPDASFLVFNFREGEKQTQIADALFKYDMTLMEYPWQYEGSPLLTMEMIHHFLRSGESWLSLGQQNILLMHCERGGWPVLAFMLAGLLIYRKQYSGELKTLDMIHRQAPRELLQLFSALNPVPSQLRYLQYVSRRNVASDWPPLDRALTLDCVILRFIPNFDGGGGCRPLFRVYGQDPFLVSDRTSKLLYSTQKEGKVLRAYKQIECELVKVDINCHIQGDVVLECISLNDDMEREEMMFRAVFNTAFIRSNILMLNRDEIDMLWDAKDRFPKDFRAEILFSEMDAAASIVAEDFTGFEEKEGLPVEAFAKVKEIFSSVDWSDPNSDAARNLLQQISASNISQEDSNADLRHGVQISTQKQEMSPGKEFASQSMVTDTTVSTVSSERALTVSAGIEPMKPKGGSISPLTPTQLRPLRPAVTSSAVKVFPHSLPTLDLSVSEPVDHLSIKENEAYLDRRGKSLSVGLQPTAPTTPPHLPLKEDNSSIKTECPTPPPPPTPPLKEIRTTRARPPSPPPPSKENSTVGAGPSMAPVKENNTIRAGPPPPPPPPPPPTPPLKENNTNAARPPPPPPPPPPMPPLKENNRIGAGPPPSTPPPPAPPLKEHSTIGAGPPPPPPPAPPFKEHSIIGAGPPPPPPPPPLKENRAIGARPHPPPPPPPPLNSGPKTSPTVSSPMLPVPPPLPIMSTNSSHGPSAPPPPSGKGTLKTGNNGNIKSPGSSSPAPPTPAPPLGSPSISKGRLSRTISSRNNQTKKLKPLHWLKLTRAVQGSLWAEAQKSGEASKAPEIDMSELENLFSAAVSSTDHGGKSSVRGSRGPKIDKVQLVDHRRAYNCEIMLSKVKVPLHELMSLVLSLENSSLDVDQVDNLIKFCPTKEEMELLKGYTGEKEKLGKCEQFFLELMKVPRVESKLRVFSFKMQFHSQIKNSAKLKRIMQTILSLGNALNQGTARGSAIGFRLDSLLKLTDTRARNNKMTLMHYLCKVLADKLPELLDFSKDLASLEPASKIQLKFLAEEMQAISKGLEKVVQELSASESDGPISDMFCKTLKEFLHFAEAEVRSLASLYSGVVGLKLCLESCANLVFITLDFLFYFILEFNVISGEKCGCIDSLFRRRSSSLSLRTRENSGIAEASDVVNRADGYRYLVAVGEFLPHSPYNGIFPFRALTEVTSANTPTIFWYRSEESAESCSSGRQLTD